MSASLNDVHLISSCYKTMKGNALGRLLKYRPLFTYHCCYCHFYAIKCDKSELSCTGFIQQVQQKVESVTLPMIMVLKVN